MLTAARAETGALEKSARLAALCSGCHSQAAHDISHYESQALYDRLIDLKRDQSQNIMSRLMRGFPESDIRLIADYISAQAADEWQ